jgi:hypothetical protein
MGTAYLATQEIVETKYDGTISGWFWNRLRGTVVTGRSTGLRVVMKTLRVDAVLSLERKFAAGHQDETSFRQKMEEMTAGVSLLQPRYG